MTAKEICQKTIAARINGDKKHGWGVNDSLAVIVALISNETGEAYGEKDKDGNVFGAELIAKIKEVVNPSQFRQKLESANLLDKSPDKAAKVESMLADFKV